MDELGVLYELARFVLGMAVTNLTDKFQGYFAWCRKCGWPRATCRFLVIGLRVAAHVAAARLLKAGPASAQPVSLEDEDLNRPCGC